MAIACFSSLSTKMYLILATFQQRKVCKIIILCLLFPKQ
uniref:Uncharacterized protein n=1 Tax=Lepeophtheirus salmonis TaxID=72036 RepID=A0A0K2TNN6_LEPSM